MKSQFIHTAEPVCRHLGLWTLGPLSWTDVLVGFLLFRSKFWLGTQRHSPPHVCTHGPSHSCVSGVPRGAGAPAGVPAEERRDGEQASEGKGRGADRPGSAGEEGAGGRRAGASGTAVRAQIVDFTSHKHAPSFSVRSRIETSKRRCHNGTFHRFIHDYIHHQRGGIWHWRESASLSIPAARPSCPAIPPTW